ncbi:hypothetical protein BC832DRAFT_42168 [Gaertneriomyces semiglobifer]|nr:hypothetical protein BC832DRAFT_42168 [Gaertneriomyces semiglobifer]
MTSSVASAPVRKKPGRKPATTEPANKRTAQNRAAQRAFRERKERYVKELETRIAELETSREKAESGVLMDENEQLRRKLQELENENKVLRDMSGFQWMQVNAPGGAVQDMPYNFSEAGGILPTGGFATMPTNVLPHHAGNVISPQGDSNKSSTPITPTSISRPEQSPHDSNGTPPYNMITPAGQQNADMPSLESHFFDDVASSAFSEYDQSYVDPNDFESLLNSIPLDPQFQSYTTPRQTPLTTHFPQSINDMNIAATTAAPLQSAYLPGIPMTAASTPQQNIYNFNFTDPSFQTYRSTPTNDTYPPTYSHTINTENALLTDKEFEDFLTITGGENDLGIGMNTNMNMGDMPPFEQVKQIAGQQVRDHNEAVGQLTELEQHHGQRRSDASPAELAKCLKSKDVIDDPTQIDELCDLFKSKAQCHEMVELQNQIMDACKNNDGAKALDLLLIAKEKKRMAQLREKAGVKEFSSS